MKPLISARVTETNNIGDAVCSPLQYFQFDGCARSFHDLRCLPPDGPVIFGGGGLLHPGLDSIIETEVKAQRRKVILWGLGTNYHDQDPPEPDWLSDCALAGVRDHHSIFGRMFLNPRVRYVPCPSCMNTEFDRPRSVKEPLVIYEHQDYPIAAPEINVPRMNNWGSEFDFGRALDFIGSAATIITNTFHGLYWALLLGRRAVCWKPFSSRFSYLKPTVIFCDELNWRKAVEKSRSFPDYLAECRRINRDFAGIVSAVIA